MGQVGGLRLQPDRVRRMKGSHFTLTGGLALLVVLFTAPAGAAPYTRGELQQLFVARCSSCHSSDVVLKEARTRAAWQSLLEVKKGMMRTDEGEGLSEADASLIVDYLATYVTPETLARRQKGSRLFLLSTVAFLGVLGVFLYYVAKRRKVTPSENL